MEEENTTLKIYKKIILRIYNMRNMSSHPYYQEKLRRYRLLKEVASQLEDELKSYKLRNIHLKQQIILLTEKIHRLNSQLVLLTDNPELEEVDVSDQANPAK